MAALSKRICSSTLPLIFPVILMPAAGGQDAAIRMRRQKLPDDRDALFGRSQMVQPEFEKRFSGIGLAARMFKQLLRVRKTHRDADARKRC